MRNYARAAGRGPGSEISLRTERKRYLTHLTVRKGDRIVILRVREIEAIESAGNYVVVQAGKDSLVVRETLAALSEQLEPEKFMRVSRSAIVNLRHVKELLPNFVGDKVVVLQSGKHLTVTRRLRDVEEALKFA
jgi:two-component system, LytTR family, response regulator